MVLGFMEEEMFRENPFIRVMSHTYDSLYSTGHRSATDRITPSPGSG